MKITRLIKRIEESYERLSDLHTGKNSVYKICDVGMSAFSVFIMQNLSFLVHQPGMNCTKDTVMPKGRHIFGVRANGYLEKSSVYANQVLVAIDRTEYFSSKTIQRENCNHREQTMEKPTIFIVP